MRPRILAILAIAAVLAAVAGAPPAPASRALAATGSVEAGAMPPPAPTGLTTAAGELRLRRDAAPGAASYRVESAALPDGPRTLVGETTATEMADPDASAVAPGYLVRAIDPAGNVGAAATLEVDLAAPSTTPGTSATPGGDERPADGGTGAVPLVLTATGGLLLAGAVILVVRRRATRA